MIPLVCGNPAQEPASYTRFVLPFAYRLEKCRKKPSPYFYKPSEPASVWRQNYLTVETAAVLFHRAKWFELEGIVIPDFQILRDGRYITVCVGTPRLVLFEWPTDPQIDFEDDQGDPLCIGFLIVEVYFPTQEVTPSLDDLLELNEMFRHWQQPYAGYEEKYKSCITRSPFDVLRPRQGIRDTDPPELYLFENWAPLLEIPIKDNSECIWKLVPEAWGKQAREWVWIPGCRKAWDSGWIVYTDHRTFVWTCALVEHGGKKLQELFSPSSSIEASSFGHWVKLLNVDSPGTSPEVTHNARQFERAWAKKRTYHRWEEEGTFYGFSYHCGALLGPPRTEPPLWKHFGEMYFDQTLLLLYLRVASFNYSRRLSRISAKARDETNSPTAREDWRREFQQLRWSFALFTNLYEFPLLSSQQQGIEMYELARKHLDVEELFREIQEEIRSSHDYLAIEAGQKQTEITTRLTVVATLGLGFGLASGFLGMNIIVDGMKGTTLRASYEWFLFLIVVVVGLLLILSLIWFSRPISRFFDKLANLAHLPWFLRKKRRV